VAKEFKHVVVIPDIQYPFVHVPTEQAVMQYVKETKPDKIVILGDFVDFTSVTQHRNRTPISKRLSFEEELALARKKLKEWAALAPSAEKVFIPGNHEDRAERYILDNAAELGFYKLPDLLDFGGWRYAGSYDEGAGEWLGHPNGLWATHGQLVRSHSAHSAKAHFDLLGVSTITGHTHRLGAYYVTKLSGTYASFEAGTLCDPKKTPRACPTVNWQHGLASAWVSTTSKRFHVDLISINNGSFVTGGRSYGK
jgi:predicted phosphodiesterase